MHMSLLVFALSVSKRIWNVGIELLSRTMVLLMPPLNSAFFRTISSGTEASSFLNCSHVPQVSNLGNPNERLNSSFGDTSQHVSPICTSWCTGNASQQRRVKEIRNDNVVYIVMHFHNMICSFTCYLTAAVTVTISYTQQQEV